METMESQTHYSFLRSFFYFLSSSLFYLKMDYPRKRSRSGYLSSRPNSRVMFDGGTILIPKP